ncbi:MAG: MazG family protein [Rhizomicrobium sp.]
MRRLRDPDGGCPWDIEQNFETIAPYTIEEAYEVAGAIEDRDWSGLKEELGDLLLQVVYHARMAEERQLFDFSDVVAAISGKMIARHPHVFGDAKVENAAAQTVAWEEMQAPRACHQTRRRAAGRCHPRPARAATCGETSKADGKRRFRLGFSGTRSR